MNIMQKNRIPRSWILFIFSTVLWVERAGMTEAFVQTTISPGSKQNELTNGRITTSGSSILSEPSCFRRCRRSISSNRNQRQSTELYSFMGSDGGLFGIGTPELVSLLSESLIFSFVLSWVEPEVP